MSYILSKIKAKTCTIGVCLLLFVSISCQTQADTQLTTTEKVKQIYVAHLAASITGLNQLLNSSSVEKQKEFYKQARMHFKSAEPILAYADKNNYKTLNAPNILSVKEDDATDIKIFNPIGFQVIEELLYEDSIDTLALNSVVKMTTSRLALVKKNAYVQLKQHHVIWLLRSQIMRIATTGITGFDSPALNQSLKESIYTYETLRDIINIHEDHFKSKTLLKEFLTAITEAQKSLNHDFDTFDRYEFIKNHIHPQLALLLKIQKDWEVDFPLELALSNDMTSLFSKETLNMAYFSDHKSDVTAIDEKVALGKQLFNDKSLSKNYDMSCASCHHSDKGFTDGLKTFNKNQKRNTPTITYAAYQQSFFMDGRSGSLEGQIVGVVKNHSEFDMTMDRIVDRVLKKPEYQSQLDKLYKDKKRMDFNIRHAIASYVRTLNGFNSKFDKNINNKEQTLTAQEKRGFNLFTGKALCATCHFAPVFNGTVPPDFTDTELELIGVPQTKDTINSKISKDLGRYNLFHTENRKHFFKTPTLRNIAKTAPYMHNGVYTTLKEVVEFYNKGGGVGLGLDLPYQTLPFDDLQLSEPEMDAIVAFMETLTDEVVY